IFPIPTFTEMALSNKTNPCPAPLIASPIDHTSKTCISGCCIPCPYINNFYPPDHKAIQCANNFTQSTMENNLLCGIQ
ncbi:21943_t:CDS:2, partial [Gigaspora rosea]